MTDLIPGQNLQSPDGRLWRVQQLFTDQHLVKLERLDKGPREHQFVIKSYHPVKWNWERLP